MSKAFGEISNLRIAAFGGQRGHVKQAAYLLATAENARATSLVAGLAIKGSQANQGGDLMAIELSQFGHLSHKHGAGLRADARGALQDGVFVTEIIVGLNVLLDEFVELANLCFQCFAHSSDATADLGVMRHFGAVGFLGEHVNQLPAPADQFGQNLRLGLFRRSIRGFDHLAEHSEDVGIDGVGLSVFPQALCKMTDLAWIDHDGLEPRLNQFRGNTAFVSAGCFQDDLGDIEALQSGEELSVSLGSIGVITLELGWAGGDLERIFSDVNSDIQWCGHGNTPFLPMRASLSASQAAVRVNPIAATRTMLSDGLFDLDTIGLTSLVADSARYARLAGNHIVYGTLYHV